MVLQLWNCIVHNSQLNAITLHFTITCIITLRNVLIQHLFIIVSHHTFSLTHYYIMWNKAPQSIARKHACIKNSHISRFLTFKVKHSIKPSNSHKDINWHIKHEKFVVIIVQGKLKRIKHLKINFNLIL